MSLKRYRLVRKSRNTTAKWVTKLVKTGTFATLICVCKKRSQLMVERQFICVKQIFPRKSFIID